LFVAGVDDAGRGSLIGPLVVAGVLFKEQDIKKLEEIGVKDSKLLTPTQRSELAEKIKFIALKYKFVEISPQEIDRVVLEGKKRFKLNWLEAKAMAEVIKNLKPDLVYVDASDVNAERFGKQIENFLPIKVKIVSEHKADKTRLVVGAASILAKVHRDNIIAKLRSFYGDLGSGYPHDPKTLNFLRKWFKDHKEYPEFLRKSWKTTKKVRLEILSNQEKLRRYFT